MIPLTNRQAGFTSSKLVVTLLGVVVIAAALAAFFIFKPQPKINQTNDLTTSQVNDVAKTMPAKQYNQRITHPDETYNLVIKNNKVTSGPADITVQQGQSVNVNFITPGSEIDIVLEGYVIITETNNLPGSSGGFHFIADKTGTFRYYIPGEPEEAEHSDEPAHDVQLGTITVKPV